MQKQFTIHSLEPPAGVAADDPNRLLRAIPLLNSQGISGSNKPAYDEMMSRFQKQMAVDLCSKGLIDPAYGYALRQVDFIPRPQGRTISRYLCRQWQERWNNEVDKYISLGKDKRSKKEIELAAKIGLSGGALFRTCEGLQCGKLEGRDILTLRVCSKCKIAVYCNQACQTSAWKKHKAMCGNVAQREQTLPSQDAFDAYAMPRIMDSVS